MQLIIKLEKKTDIWPTKTRDPQASLNHILDRILPSPTPPYLPPTPQTILHTVLAQENKGIKKSYFCQDVR